MSRCDQRPILTVLVVLVMMGGVTVEAACKVTRTLELGILGAGQALINLQKDQGRFENAWKRIILDTLILRRNQLIGSGSEAPFITSLHLLMCQVQERCTLFTRKQGD